MHIQVTLWRFLTLFPLILAVGCSASDYERPPVVGNAGLPYVAQADTLFFYRKLTGAVDGRQVTLDLTRERGLVFAQYTVLETGEVVRFNGSNAVDETGALTLARYSDDAGTQADGAAEEIVAVWNPDSGILEGQWQRGGQTSDVRFETDGSTDFVRLRLAHADSVVGDCGDYPCLSIQLTWPELEGPGDYTVINQTILSYVSSSPHFMDWSTGGQAGTVQSFVDSMARHYSREKERAKEIEGYEPTWSRDFTGKVVYNHKGLLSLELDDFAYMGGAHPNKVTILLSFDYENDTRLSLQDVFKEGAFEALDTLALARLRDRYQVPANKSLQEFGFFVDADNALALPENFSVEPDGIRFLFNPYEIAPYVFGAVEVRFPYGDIKPYLQPHFIERMGI